MSKPLLALRRREWASTAAAVLLLPGLCLATDVQVVGVTPGRSADVVIDGGAPITIEVGDTAEGVRVLRVERDGATLRVDGRTQTLTLVPYRGSAGNGGGSSVTLVADDGGHFTTRGSVNGEPVRFIVDTGATLTTLSRGSAERIGLDYEEGTPTLSMTANGLVMGWRVSLDSVKVGTATVRDIDAIVLDNDALPVVLLGMNFLQRFDMHRHDSTLVLRRRR